MASIQQQTLATAAGRSLDVELFGTPFHISVVDGVDAGRSFALAPNHPGRLLVGHSGACDIQLTDRSVSRRHVAFEIVDDRLALEDLHSTNGTIVNGVSILKAELVGGEEIRIGRTTLSVRRDAPRALGDISADLAFGTVVGSSIAMRRLYPLCARIAASDVPVVIEGETGTGKEQLAESIHLCSRRKSGPFVVFDCTAVASSLIEAELFGHERGAFTGAVESRRGVFERANGGTLFIDEIGDLPLELQSKLLRAVERLEVRRIGGNELVRVNCRIVAATRRNLDQQVQLGLFRDDLFHRLAITRIELPPLRSRRGDVTELARRFWRELGGDSSGLSDELLRGWEHDEWPGNVRQLKNAVLRRHALGDLGVEESPRVAEPATTSAALHAVTRDGDAMTAVLALELPLAEARQRIVDEFEQRYLVKVLEKSGGDVNRAAAAAGIAARHLRRLRARHLD